MNTSAEHHKHYIVQIYSADLTRTDHKIGDPEINGRQVIELTGVRSADDFSVLQFLPNGATEERRLEEQFPLDAHQENRFFVAKADGTSNLFIDGMRVAWFDLPITGATIRLLAGKGEEVAVFQDFPGLPSKRIEDREAVSLEGKGVERFHTELVSCEVTVYLADVPHKIKAGDYTTEQLKEKLGVAENYMLDLVDETGTFIELKPGEHTVVKDGMKFVGYLPTGHSS